jgi:hypothetical protein
MEPEKAVKAYKAEALQFQKTIDDYAKTVGQLSVISLYDGGIFKLSDASKYFCIAG